MLHSSISNGDKFAARVPSLDELLSVPSPDSAGCLGLSLKGNFYDLGPRLKGGRVVAPELPTWINKSWGELAAMG